MSSVSAEASSTVGKGIEAASTGANPYLAVFRPYVPAHVTLPELTPMPLVVGTLLGIVFGASSLYLVLKVGMTVSASIPVAVISITFFRLLSKFGPRDATILQNNIVQTAGSAGESIAFGVGVTMPAIMILGFDLEFTRVMLVSVLGGLLGILMMIPLRRALIVQQHGYLKYPEGTACAEVLKAGACEESKKAHALHEAEIEKGDQAASPKEPAQAAAASLSETLSAKPIYAGFGLGFIYQVVMMALKGWKDTPEKIFGKPFEAASISAEISPALLGVGYVIGPRIAAVMCGGGVLAYLVLIPAIKFFGGDQLLPPGTKKISEMGPKDIRDAYVLYIGAGAVAAGGIISLLRSLPTIGRSLQAGLKDLRSTPEQRGTVVRTERDLSMQWVLGGIAALIVVIMLAPQLSLWFNPIGAAMIVLFGFLFVTVSSRLTGEIGSSSNPISGMTVATLLLTCLIFLVIGWTAPPYFVTALSVGAIVCIAASNGGTTSQDLKTGFLVGSTPKAQQIAILVGALASALLLAPILLTLNDASTVYVPVKDKDFPTNFRVDASERGRAEKLQGVQAQSDAATYHVWQRVDEKGDAAKYLVDEQGVPTYLVDPGINGKHKTRPDGSAVEKFDAPKATLMSYIIKGILSQKLPWALVLLGVMIAIVLEMAGIPSLPFAVGVYLPISSSTPIFVGGLVRLGVDKYLRRKLADRKLSEEQLTAEGDKSPGVLMASGYIAGGALAGIVIAFMAGVLKDSTKSITEWSKAHNPFFATPHPAYPDWLDANWLALLPFLALTVLLYLVGREVLMASKPNRAIETEGGPPSS